VLTVSPGQVSATFTISTLATATVQMATLTAEAGSSTQTATLEIDPASLAQLSAFSVAPSSVQGGTSLTGTLGLTAPAAIAGVHIQVSSDNTSVEPPATVTIQGNDSSAAFTIPTAAVGAPQVANLTATLGNSSLSAQATVVPLLQLTLAESSIKGGGSLTATVTLGTAAPASGASIAVTSSDSAVASGPGTVKVAAGQTTATFTIATFTATAARTVTITATYAGAAGLLSQSAMLTVNPQGVGQLQSLTVAPTQVTGGAGATGTITLTGPAPLGGQVVQLKTSNIFYAAVPTLVTVSQGSTTATFTIATSVVASTQTVTITATAGGIAQAAVLTVE